MSFTKRKENRLKAWDKRTTILKKYSKQPLIKNVDVEELKKQFATVEVEVKPKTAKKVVASEEDRKSVV